MGLNIRNYSPNEKEQFFAMPPEKDEALGCIGHLRIDFGKSGTEFWSTWWPRGPEELNSPTFKKELDSVVNELRETVLSGMVGMRRFCTDNGGYMDGGCSPNYGYVIDTPSYRYCLRCIPMQGDYNAYLNCFDKQTQAMAQRLQKLPELCFSTLPGTGELICIKRGESGYYPSDWSTDDPAQNKELADFNNRKLGVTEAQRQAMECGSMAGWDAPGADPTFYDFADQGTVSMTMGGL